MDKQSHAEVVVDVDESIPNGDKKKTGWIRNHKSTIWAGVAIASLVFGILGVWIGCKNRDFVYVVHSPRTIVFQKSVGGDFEVSFKGEPVTFDVMAVSITLWNDGREAIRRNHVVGKPPTIQLTPPVPIYSMKVVSQSRPDIVKFELDGTKAESGTVGIKWDILDQDDGANIQLIYGVPTDAKVDVKVHADFEGKTSAREGSFRNLLSNLSIGTIISVIILFFFLYIIAFGVWHDCKDLFMAIRKKQTKSKKDLIGSAITVAMAVGFFCLIVALSIHSMIAYKPPPPVF